MLNQEEKKSKEFKLSYLDDRFEKTRWIVKDILKTGFDENNIVKNRMEGFYNIEDYKNPSLDLLHNPFLMEDMEKSVARINLALEDNEGICVYGDYDVDGMSSVAILLKAFQILGHENLSYYIPSRSNEGYGVNMLAAKKIISSGAGLLITVDCGITSVEEVDFLSENSVDTIITDHHTVQDEIPKAYGILNPKKKSCTYPFKDLCGAGIAYKLAGALLLSNGNKPTDEMLEICSVATIADIVPLIGENRIIVKNGLKSLQNTSNLGLSSLIEKSGINKNNIGSKEISFAIAPRLNSTGRIGNASKGLKLYMENNPGAAIQMADEINQMNVDRRTVENTIFNQAIDSINITDDTGFILVCGEGWHSGVTGIVSSKITAKYHLPSAVISIEDGIGKGSSRSVDGLDIFSAFESLSYLLEKFGGHKQAAGFTIKLENIPEFSEKINEIVKHQLETLNIEKTYASDMVIKQEDITRQTLDKLKALEPFGQSNEEPVFLLRSCYIENPVGVGTNGKHFKSALDTGDFRNKIGIISFNNYDRFEKLDFDKKVDLMFHLGENVYNGNSSLQLSVLDIRQSKSINSKLPEIYKTLKDLVHYDLIPLSSNFSKDKINTCSSEDIINFDENTVFLCKSYEAYVNIISLLDYALMDRRVYFCPNSDEINSIKNQDNIKNIVLLDDIFLEMTEFEKTGKKIFLMQTGRLPKNIFSRHNLTSCYKYLFSKLKSKTSISSCFKFLRINPARFILYLLVFEKMGLVQYDIDFTSSQINVKEISTSKEKSLDEYEIIKNLRDYFGESI